jgi:hypothetical protein
MRRGERGLPARAERAFAREADAGPRRENASKQETVRAFHVSIKLEKR